MNGDDFELFVGDVTDMEATVYVRYLGADDATTKSSSPGHAGGRIRDRAAMQKEPPTEPGADGVSRQQCAQVSGTLRGPYCEGVRTLVAEFAFRALGVERPGVAAAVVTDPCMWSPELPHLYHVEVEARQGGEVVAAYHGTMGLRRPASLQN